MTRSYYRGAICCVLVYDITKYQSFESVKRWLEDVQQHSYDKILMLLIGNKCDLVSKRQVQTKEAQ